MAIQILLADDHQMFSDGLAALLEMEPDFRVVGKALDGREAVQKALELDPDVVVMDVSMPGLNGIEATRRLTSGRKRIKVLCLSMHREQQYLSAALAAGAAGYILKEHAVEKVSTAIRNVAAGGIGLCPEMAAMAAEGYRTALVHPRTPDASILTHREREVLQLVAEGHTSHEIADMLCISERTVATHRCHLAEKLGIRGVAGLTKYAIRHGLTTADRDRCDIPTSER